MLVLSNSHNKISEIGSGAEAMRLVGEHIPSWQNPVFKFCLKFPTVASISDSTSYRLLFTAETCFRGQPYKRMHYSIFLLCAGKDILSSAVIVDNNMMLIYTSFGLVNSCVFLGKWYVLYPFIPWVDIVADYTILSVTLLSNCLLPFMLCIFPSPSVIFSLVLMSEPYFNSVHLVFIHTVLWSTCTARNRLHNLERKKDWSLV